FLNLILAVVPDPVAAIREAARVLSPEGRMVVFDKFLPDGARPSLIRRGANGISRIVATDINRQLGPLLELAGLERVKDEPAGFGGLFRIAVLRRSV
ncbi:MAG: SAM-dependent methyltransferase, partial [Ectothiorhodospiraceae bacterium]